jgi:flagella basal body P-ring formation protein FlgA
MGGLGSASIFTVACAALLVTSVLATSVRADQEIVVPRVTIYPGDHLSNGLLEVRPIQDKATSAHSVFSDPEELLGMIARRTLLVGRPIPRDAVRPEPIIRQGEPVSISYETSGILIQLSATALQSGGVGQTISVRNSDTGRIIKGRIKPDKTLIVTTP